MMMQCSPAELPTLGNESALLAPHCIDTEALVLSHCFEHELPTALQPKHFYANAHMHIYAAMLACAERSEPTDALSVARQLRAEDRLKQIGGSPYLATLYYQPATAYIDKHVEALRELYRRRTLSDVALELRVRLRAGELEAAEAWRWFKLRCEEVASDDTNT